MEGSYHCASGPKGFEMDPLYIFIFVLSASTALALPRERRDEEEVTADYRLPQIYSVERYSLDLTILQDAFTETSNEFSGIVTIEFNFTDATDYISLHAHHESIILKSVKFNNFVLNAEDYSISNATDILKITLTNPITTGHAYKLIIEFTGILSTTQMYGFYKSSYVDKDGNTKYLATTQFEPTHARRAFPSFDEPAFKAPFDVSITYPSNLNVLFNTAIHEEAAVVDVNGTDTGLTKATFETTPKLSTYLIAFIVSEFTCTDAKKVGTVNYRVCSRNETRNARNLAVDVGPKLLTHLNSFTEYDYSKGNAKMDLVAIPDFSAGAMENWGLITFREVDLLWDDRESSNRYKQVVATVVAHEQSHQWFGDLVTCNWWSEIFLNEGFATYFEYHTPHEIYPDWELDKQFVLEEVQPVLDEDELENIEALQYNASTPTEISDRFDDISYNKGGSILRMVAYFMGKEHFQEGLQAYLNNKEYDSAVPEDLWEALTPHIMPEVQLPANLSIVMDNWIKKPGFPLVSVTSNGNAITISQQRLLKSGKDDDTKWYIPITYTTSDDSNKFQYTTPNVWLTPEKNESVTFLDSTKWIILNNQETGYYRVNYDETLWNNISSALQSEHFGWITELNRAQIVDDLFSLAKVGIISYPRVFDITSFLTKDTSYYPWYPALDEYGFLLRRVGENSDLGNSIKDSLMTVMEELYNSVSFDENRAYNQIYSLKRALALTWACKIGHDDCVDSAKKLFEQFKTSRVKPDVNLRTVVYCNGLRYSEDKSDWEFLWNAYTEASDFASEKSTILTALGCTKDTDLLKEYLQKTITDNSGIRSQDTTSVFSAVYNGNVEGVAVAYDFLTENYNTIAEKYQSLNALGNLIKGIAERFTTEEQVNKLKDFISSEDLPEAFKTAANQAVETAESNQQWLQQYEKDLKDYYKGAGHQIGASLLVILLAIVVNRLFN